MEASEQSICLGCLSRDRKIVVVNDVFEKQSFLRLIWEIAETQTESVSVSLCWECNAQVKRFAKFKRQVQKSYIALQNVQLPQACSSKLDIHQQYCFCYPHEKQLETENFVIIPEDDKNLIKQELDEIDEKFNVEIPVTNVDYNDTENGNSCNDSEEDEKFLIDFIKDKKRRNVNKKKKKRQKSTVISVIKQEQILKIQYYRELELTQEQIEKERVSLSLKEDYVNALFKCEHCIISFPNVHDLNDHISLKHDLNATAYRCPICTCSFSSEIAFNYHAKRHLRRYECVVCFTKFPSENRAVKHYENVHCVRTDQVIDKIFNSNQNKQQNVENSIKKEKPSGFPCESCNKVFKWKTSLRKHAETHSIETGQKRRPYCDVCRLSFNSTSNLQKHAKTSSKHQIELKLRKLKTSCPDKQSPGQQDASLKEIKSVINRDRQTYPCGQCDRKFQWRGNLLRHLHSHKARANGDLVCEPCKRTFSSIATYKQHMKISRKHVSESEFKYMCSECGQKFANKTRLKDHVNWDHLKNYTHKCPDCGKVFKSHTSLYLHKQVVHKKGGIEHLCHHCGKAFPNRTKLRSHVQAIHTTESPYICVTCNARFSWHSCLSRHIRRVHKSVKHENKTVLP